MQRDAKGGGVHKVAEDGWVEGCIHGLAGFHGAGFHGATVDIAVKTQWLRCCEGGRQALYRQ